MNKYERYMVSRSAKTLRSNEAFDVFLGDQELLNMIWSMLPSANDTHVQWVVDPLFTSNPRPNHTFCIVESPPPPVSQPGERVAHRIAEQVRRGYDSFRDFLGYGQGTRRRS